MLAGTGFGDELLLAHALGQKGFAQAVVDFMGTGVVQVFTLEIDLSSADLFREVFAVKQRAGAAYKIFKKGGELLSKGGVFLDFVIGCGDFVQNGLKFGGNKAAAIVSEVTVSVGHFKGLDIGIHGLSPASSISVNYEKPALTQRLNLFLRTETCLRRRLFATPFFIPLKKK